MKIVIIGDIEHSKKLNKDTRKQVQNTLNSVFRKINEQSEDVISPYTITLGDEFQAVYHSASALFKHIWMIMAEIHPVFARISIGIGEITTGINRENALGMDGPAFYKARDRIEHMRDKKYLLAISTADPEFDRLINSMFRILGANFRTWKKNRFTILYKQYEDKGVKKIAKEIGLSEVAVYKNINTGTLEAIRELTGTISKTMDEML